MRRLYPARARAGIRLGEFYRYATPADSIIVGPRHSRDSATRPSGGRARRSSKILHLEQRADLDLERSRRRAGAAFGPVDRLVQILDLPEPVAGGEPAIGAIVGERAFGHRPLLAG